ncbi:uncharacterized protein LOC115217281 isoform X2 [Octopus sinensis]|uniref:Uncharacterized protein LOC115217281 isoform X2 n=1 Tax=Octopus sinensis TaxID=2607531 RepID=A0A6P7SX33_9MOLL|nr:uncharacterized protein LOC115217281 isoform X2 [Octopus sinensis]
MVCKIAKPSSMGLSLSCNASAPRDIGSEASPGLLPVTDLIGKRYPFTNLVFEGCGVKGYAFVGTLKVLEKVGILYNIKRFAGMGSGAIVACLLAIGYDANSVQSLLDMHLQSLTVDLQYTPNVSHEEALGWKDGRRFHDWLGEILTHRFQDADISFQQLYDKIGHELCIPVMNLNQNKMEYFHPKTTPDFVIRRAVSLAMSIPGIYRPRKLSLSESSGDFYMDGGIICNYPIHCFDGWWLSMEPGDRFLRKCQPSVNLSSLELDCFFGFNHMSLGIMTFDDYHNDEIYDIMKRRLDQTGGVVPLPATELSMKWKEARDKLQQMQLMCTGFEEAYEKLRHILETLKGTDNLVSIVNLVGEVTKGNNFSTAEINVLFGVGNNARECYELLRAYANSDDRMPAFKVVSFVERRHWQSFYDYSQITPKFAVNNLSSFWGAVNSVSNEKNKAVTKTDLFRTVGIYTGHVTNNDDSLHEADAAYLYQHGWNCAVAFLRDINLMSMPSTSGVKSLLSSSSDTS